MADYPHRRGGAASLRYAVHQENSGRATGYALHRHGSVPDGLGGSGGVAEAVELAALSRQAYAVLWRFLAGIDLVTWIDYEGAVDEPLPHLLVGARAVRGTPVDRLWVRPVDAGRALAGRTHRLPLDLVLDVRDDFCPWNTGRHGCGPKGTPRAANPRPPRPICAWARRNSARPSWAAPR
ncbi:hypothetical protein RND61_31625 [Streptomyces sp. TRM76323]|uniref:Eis-like acetyltransferase domain-containing protein n=1 Tax=Streptomyces tamarix TaxID=3078565 RepID=A0ABU3QUZ1_9ACTN|nr:hypothetical protein [Streptomyces tamarix]MDT9686579.1 hypothetical protein [Streptomyces tamarix]